MANLYKRVGGEFLVNSQTANNQSGQHVARLPNGGFVVVWADGSTVGDPNIGIKAQLFDSAGAKVGGEFLVNTTTAGTQNGARVTALADGRFVITWNDLSATGGDTSSSAVRGQLYEANGTPVGGEFLVNTVVTSSQSSPTITGLAGGGFVIAWSDSSAQGADTSGSGIKLQLFDANGAKVGGELLANTTTQGSQSSPSIIALAGGGFAVGWNETFFNGVEIVGAVRVQMFDAAGAKVGGELQASATSGGNFTQTHLAALSSGFVVTWAQQEPNGSFNFDVRGQLYDSAGAKVGAEFVVSSTTAGSQMAPSAAALPGGGFIITWQGPGEGISGLNVYGQVYNSAGVRVGVEFILSSISDGSQSTPKVDVLASGDIVVTWVDSSGIGGDSQGAAVKAEFLTLSSDAPSDISLSAAVISETAREDVGLVTLSTTGTLNSSYTYELLSDSTGGAFRIEGDKLVVDNNDLLNFETAPTVQLQIRSTDLNGNSFTETIALAIGDSPETAVQAGDQFPVNTTTSGNQSASTVTLLASGAFVISWTDWNLGGRAQVYDSDGNKVGSEVAVNGVLAALPGGGFVATFQATGGDGSYGGIAIRLYDDSGNAISGEIPVNTTTAGDQSVDSVAALESGGFVVTWTDRAPDPFFTFAPADVRAQRFDANGAKIGSEFLVNTTTAYGQGASLVAGLSSGGFVITWEDSAYGGLRGQMFDPNGVRLGQDFRIDTSSPSPFEHQIAALPGGGFVVLWSKNISSGGYTGVDDLTAQIFDAQGVRVGTELLITGNGPAQVDSIGVSALDWGGFVVTWNTYDQNAGHQVRAQIFDPTGGRIGDELAVNQSGGGLFQPRVSGLASGGFLVTWTEPSGDGNGMGVQARLFESVSTISGTGADDVLNGTAGVDHMFGDAGNDTLNGLAGNDLLDGGIGNDSMNGGAGNDAFVVDSAGDVVTENAGEGIDEVRTGLVSYALGANVEELTGTSGAGQSLTGNALDNVISGGAGADSMAGGAGNDRYTIGAGDSVTENAGEGTDEVRTGLASYTLGANLENLVGTSASGQTLTGNSANNAITGGAGNDVIDGGAGGDVMNGGAGNDLYFVDSASDAVVDLSGTDEIRTGLATYTASLGIEKLTGTSSLGQVLSGSPFGATNITGGSGDDTLIGNGGGTLIGGLGNDIYVDPHPHPTFAIENPGEGIDEIRFSSYQWFLADNFENLTGTSSSSSQVLWGNGANNVLRAGAGGATLYGEGGDDTLIGSAANEQLRGGSGSDHMTGGGGDDFYVDVGAGDQVVELAGGGTDSINTSLVTYVLPDHVENLTATATSAQSLTGNAQANLIYGTDYSDFIDGGAGDDTLQGGFGDDVYVVDSAGDTVTDYWGDNDEVRTGLSTYTLAANIERLTGTSAAGQALTGNGLGNVITGSIGDDVIDGGLGADSMNGGLGNDSYHIDNVGDAVGDGGGVDSVFSTITHALGADFENLTLTGAAAIDGYGNNSANSLTGNGSNNLLDGGLGADLMTGGLGNDVYIVDNGSDQVVEASGAGTDEVRTALASYALGADIEKLTGLSAGGQILTGNGLDNIIAGGSGNDQIDGGLGADSMTGGLGNDIFVVETLGDTVIELGGGGADEVRTTLASYVLAGEVEALTGTSNLGQSLTGNGLANLITAGWGNDLIDGGLAADDMRGSLGNDIYMVDNAGDTVTEAADQGLDEVRTNLASFSLAPFANVENLTGGSADQSLTGNGFNNLIDGGAGADAMAGGGGHDVYIVDNLGDSVTELEGAGTDEVRTNLGSKAAPDYALYVLAANVENLTGTSAGAQGVRGNALNNVIVMGVGADLIVLDDGGVDSVDAGSGNDFIYYGATLTGSDTTNGGAGTDTLGLLGNYTGGSAITFTAANLVGVERLAMYTGGGTNSYNVTMNDSNVAAGAEFFVTAASLTSTETLFFNGFAETNGRFTVLGGSGADTIVGGRAGDFLAGNAGADTLYALTGNDFLVGGLGADQLNGGGGFDQFRYESVAQSMAGSVDHILDFTDLDRIDLSAIDANNNAGDGNSAFTFIGTGVFTNVAGQLRATGSGSAWMVEGDTNGDGIADLIIQVTITDPSLPALGASDFIL